MCDSGKWETFCERSKERRSARKISRCARNDSVGNGYPLYHTKSVWEMRSFRIVIPSEAEGSFSLAVRGSASDSEKRETPYRGKTVGGASYKRLSEGGGKGGDEKDFSTALEMTVWGDGFISRSVQRICL